MSEKPYTGPLPTAGRLRRRLLTFGIPLAALAGLYVVDLVVTASKVPRGVTAAGVPLGGLTPAAAEQRLREAISARESQPVPVTVGALSATVDPGAVGLAADPAATVAQAGGQPLDPVTRITSFFVDTPVELVTSVNEQALTATLDELGTAVAEDPVEGSIVFVGGEPTPSDPRSGWRLDVPAAAEAFVRDWAAGEAVALPMQERPPQTTAADVATALEEIATPAVSGPVIISGVDVRGVITADVIAAALTFTPEPGRLMPELDEDVIVDALRPQLTASEVPVRNADIDFAATPPVKTPAQDGRRLDYDATLADFLDVLGRTDDRRIDAVYVEEKATFGFDELNQLGPVEVIGEFQTGGFSGDSGRNIRRAAEQINGVVVGPGEIFSLNAATNPRNAASGYVEAGIIENGRPARGVGGGVSQVATTLFNAAYFAGLEDVEHHEHSYYISRYPAGREATVFGDVLDVKFRNDGPTSVQIQTQWTPSAVTIRVVGIKRYEVTSAQSARSRPTSPQTISIPAGAACSASGGAPGFTITDTRTLRDIATGDTRTQSHTVTYDPIPRVVCGG
ncbi:VanW family protein [Mycolicibacterium bacteremicum]|uniref:VanW family protein n=1 Tax=Mycolicibacterium bacteremicum TaxID=564198 RepID=UPI0026EF3571|nr:VanW family protein [Mycolicibacterium bacteremicum]